LSTTVSQGSVATRVNYGKIFHDFFIANLLLSVMVKEFWRSVRIRQSYGKKSSGTFFSGHGVVPESFDHTHKHSSKLLIMQVIMKVITLKVTDTNLNW